MSIHPASKQIKEAKFIEALVDTAGNATEAYKAIKPQVTHHSARALGSKTLATISQDDTKSIMERVGCTKEAVINGIWKRIEGTRKVGDYVRGADVICKVGGYYESKNTLKDAMDAGLDLVEIIKVRLRKSSDIKPLQQSIDIPSKSTDNVVDAVISDGTATSKAKE
jgi:hypothetical protein